MECAILNRVKTCFIIEVAGTTLSHRQSTRINEAQAHVQTVLETPKNVPDFVLT